MDGMIILGLFMALLFGGGTLALVMGYVSTEERRAEEERERGAQDQIAAQAIAMIPRMFRHPDAIPTHPAHVATGARLLSELESYVIAEQALVAQFVAEPSVDSLYRQPGMSVVN